MIVYNVTYAGTCPQCHVTVTTTAGQCSRLPDDPLGSDAVTLKCFDGHEFPARPVGLCVDPYTAAIPDEDA